MEDFNAWMVLDKYLKIAKSNQRSFLKAVEENIRSVGSITMYAYFECLKKARKVHYYEKPMKNVVDEERLIMFNSWISEKHREQDVQESLQIVCENAS